MTDEVRKCGDVKRGRVTLRCELLADHPGWHKATFREDTEIRYDGALHHISITEKVDWEPVDHTREAVRHLMAKRGETAP